MPSDFDEFRLTAWPELDATFGQVAHKRLVTSLSIQYQTIAELRASSGLSRNDVRTILRALAGAGALESRAASRETSTIDLFAPIGPQLIAAVRRVQEACRALRK